MTGGRVVILGTTGRNFGAGMSGGVAYVWDKAGNFDKQCNTGTFELEAVSAEADAAELRTMIQSHLTYTGSTVASNILENWETELTHFVKVMPSDYKRVLMEMASENDISAATG
jgi:glutamate synthase (NADPH/NADH) large chain